MPLTDSAGYAVSGASAVSLEAFEQAAYETRCLVDDPVASVDRALAAAPEMTMAWALKGWLHLLGTEPAGLPIARDCIAAATALPANERERAHLDGLAKLADGRWHAASRMLEDLSVAWPHDALALQVGHQIDYFTGNARMLRDRIARALPDWDRGQPGYHALLGMHAFGLEECGDYEQAERNGRRSVELEPRDGWGWHAVAHTMEMRNRADDGVGWLRPNAEKWSPGSFLAVHNWWHLALFELELDNVDEALCLFDGPIHGARSAVVLDLIDASSMLWRLSLRGVEIGDRWQTVADGWTPIAGAGSYAFNDLHAMMAFVGSERRDAQRQVLEAQRAVVETGGGNAGFTAGGDNQAFTRDVGMPACLAFQAFGDGNYAETVRLLRSIRGHAHRFGGSHAQRDVIDLTLIEAALRADDTALATALSNERLAMRPRSPLARLFVQRAARRAELAPSVAAG
ncbi:MAG TPA: tetratricopeptide repeat protein [Burkholderiaceae bacterium]|nr:tetratricopeptide repeat protein [Burkholderiaceae bacterium]